MSFLVPKKPQILYAPMLASFGGGSARGFNPGGSQEPPLYPFTSVTFQESLVGNTGNSWSVFQSRYASQAFYTSGNMVVGQFNGYQKLTLPSTGVYEFELAGAPGTSTGAYPGGYGRKLKGRMSLSQSDVIQFVTGKAGGNPSQYAAGGGGGTFVVKNSFFNSGGQTNSNIIAVAGGGAGGAYDEQATQTRMNGAYGTSGSDGENNTGSGGVNGDGGDGNNLSGDNGSAGPAAGIFSNGTNFTYSAQAVSPAPFATGAIGGLGYYSAHPSGFGCSGAGGNYAGGPGGGYSGGGGGTGNGYPSGGGSSYTANLTSPSDLGTFGDPTSTSPSQGGYLKLTFIG